MRKNKLQTLADELEEVIKRREDAETLLVPLKEYEEQIREKLVDELLKVGFTYVKTTSGKGFGIVQGKKTYTIVKGREQDAIQWAQSHYPAILSINKSDLGKVLKPMLTLPEFFEEKVGESHLAVRSANEKEV